ncbi:MAG: D-2-hydroxyacid dehydrogenase family protein [Limibacillus sp.]
MRIAVLDDYQGVALDLADWSRLEEKAEIEVFRDTITDEEALVERLEPFEVICAMRERTPLPAALLERLPNLKLIVSTGHRNASIDVAAAKGRGVTVCGTDSSAFATSELALTLLLALSRRLLPQALSVREGGWQVGLGRDLKDAELGIIGLGRLGGRMAELVKPLGMKVSAWSQNLTQERCDELGVTKRESLSALLEEADFVTIHTRPSARTEGLMNAEAFARMKPDAALINTSRASIVERQALFAWLDANPAATAALDVFEEEPLPEDDPIRRHPQLLLTPHVGYVSRENYTTFYRQTVENIEAWLAGQPLREMKG